MNRIEKLTLFLGCLIVLICFFPILKSGLYSDDLPNFQFKTLPDKLHPQNAIQLSLPLIEYWKHLGRFTPVSFFYEEMVYKTFTTIGSYKFFVMMMNLIAVVVFVLFLKVIHPKINYGIWLVCFASVIQFRISYHDAFTSLNGMYQLLSIFIFAGSALYCSYMKNKKPVYFIFSLICFVTGILISEVGLTTLLLIPASMLVLAIPFKTFLKSFSYFVVISILYLGYIVWLRMHVKADFTYPGLVAVYDLNEMMILLSKQLYAAIPLSNLHNKAAIPVVLFHQLKNFPNFISVILIGLISMVIFWNLHRYKNRIKVIFNYKYLLFSMTLIIVPALFIMPSSKYQQEVHWGVGYLPVYLQNFGTATLFYFLIYYCFTSLKPLLRFSSYLLFFVLVICAVSTLLFNNALVDAKSYSHSFPAQKFYEFIKTGELQNCENGGTIILGNDFYWRAPDYYATILKKITGKDFNVYDVDMVKIKEGSIHCYLLDCETGDNIIISLFKMNCSNFSEKVLIKKQVIDCPIRLIPEERNILF